MIEIVKSQPYRMCNCCYSNDNVIEIFFRSDHQGVGVAICKKCREELIAELNRIEKIESYGKPHGGSHGSQT